MIDSRPRPEYGEYATPAEQAEAMGITVEELAAVQAPKAAPGKSVDAVPTPASTEPGDATGASQLPPPRADEAIPLPPPGNAAATEAGPTSRRWDVTISLALVFFGVYLVFGSIGSFRELGTAMDEGMKSMGAGQFTSIALADSFGFWLSIIEPVILVITVGITLIRLRAGKIAFFVPIIGAVVGTIVLFVFFVILLSADPAFMAFMQSRQ